MTDGPIEQVFDEHDSEWGGRSLLTGRRPSEEAREELARLRLELSAALYGVGNGPAYFLDGDSPCVICDGDAHLVCVTPTPELAQELLVALNGWADRQEAR